MSKDEGKSSVYVTLPNGQLRMIGVLSKAFPPKKDGPGKGRKWSQDGIIALAVSKYLDAMKPFTEGVNSLEELLEKLGRVDPDEIQIDAAGLEDSDTVPPVEGSLKDF